MRFLGKLSHCLFEHGADFQRAGASRLRNVIHLARVLRDHASDRNDGRAIDHLGLDGFANQIVALQERIRELEIELAAP